MDPQKLRTLIATRYQYYLDRSSPFMGQRWMVLVSLLVFYFIRVVLIKGFYIVSYALAIYNLNLLLGFLTPQFDPETEGPSLPTKGDQEFKPFMRRLPEFKFWYSCCKSIVIAFCCTFFSVFDVPVFWPILLLYWMVLFFVTMKRQIKHMIKYKYIPWDLSKKRYTGASKSSR